MRVKFSLPLLKVVPQLPEDAKPDEQLKTFVPCPYDGIRMPKVITASARTTRSLLLRVLRERIITAPNDSGAPKAGVPGRYDRSRCFTVSRPLYLFPFS